MVANKGLMEIIREFAEEHPLSGYDALEIEQHRELCQIISDYGYRSIDLKEVRKERSEDHRLVMMYIDRKKYPATENGPCNYADGGDHIICSEEDEDEWFGERVCKSKDAHVL